MEERKVTGPAARNQGFMRKGPSTCSVLFELAYDDELRKATSARKREVGFRHARGSCLRVFGADLGHFV